MSLTRPGPAAWRRDDERGVRSPPPGPPRRGPSRATIRRRRLTVGAALIATVTTAGLGLRAALATSPPPMPSGIDRATAHKIVRGVAGLVPGGPGRRYDLVDTIDVAAGGDSLDETDDLTPRPAAPLPASCPAAAWDVGWADDDSRGRVVLVALAPDAPASCQGFSATLPITVPSISGPPRRTRTAARVEVATLGTPQIALRSRTGGVVAVPIAPSSGPRPSVYTVEARDGDRWTPVCLSATPAPCVVAQSANALRVTASIESWQRTSSAAARPA